MEESLLRVENLYPLYCHVRDEETRLTVTVQPRSLVRVGTVMLRLATAVPARQLLHADLALTRPKLSPSLNPALDQNLRLGRQTVISHTRVFSAGEFCGKMFFVIYSSRWMDGSSWN